MRKQIQLMFVLLLAVSFSGIAQENNGYMNLVASHHSVASPDGAMSVPRDGTIVMSGFDAYLELKQGVDESVAESANWKHNTKIGLSNEEVARLIVISPNPVMDRFHLKVPAEVGEVKQAGIYNMDGGKVRSFGSRIGDGKDRDLEMDATDLIPGLYFLRIENEAGIISKSFEVIDF